MIQVKVNLYNGLSNHGGEEGKASSGTFAEAASFGEMIVIATSWDGTSNAIKMADPTNFAGKIVIDVTNPLDFSKGMPPKLAVGYSDSRRNCPEIHT